MEITGSQRIAAPRDAVWAALNDPEVLKACLPGCESVERTGENAFQVVVAATVGPLRARFNGSLRMTEAQPPTSCVMNFEGQGGVVGFGKGSANVALAVIPEGTELTYTAQTQVGGKLAQIGSRLVDNVAKKMADDFFVAFKARVAPVETPATDEPRHGVSNPTSKPGTPASVERKNTAHAAPVPIAISGSSPTAAAASTPAPTSAVAANPSLVMVPGWWLAVAAVLGAMATAMGVLLSR